MSSLHKHTKKDSIIHAMNETKVALSLEDWEQLMKIMNAPIKLNKNLKKAFLDFRKNTADK